MADIFSQYVGYAGELEQAKAGFGRTLFNIGASLMNETIQKKESEEYSNALGRWIEETDNYYQWQRDNADKPQEFVAELDRRRESMQTAMLEGVTTPGAKADIINRFTVDFPELRASAREKANQYAQSNMEVAFGINYDKLIEPPKFAWTKEDAQQKVDAIIELVSENFGQVPELKTQEQADVLEDSAFNQIIGYYALQEAQSEEDLTVDKLNAMAQEQFGLDEKIFDVEEAANLRTSFKANQETNAASKRLEADKAQKETVQLFSDMIYDPEQHISDTDWMTSSGTIGDKESGLYVAWSKIYDNQSIEPIESSDLDTYFELEQRIFDFYNGEFQSSIENLQTELNYAYKVGGLILEKTKDGKMVYSVPDKARLKQRINEADYMELMSRLQVKPDADILHNYRSVHESAENIYRNEKERQSFNIGLFDLIKKKPKDASYKEMQDLLISYQERRARSWLRDFIGGEFATYGRWAPTRTMKPVRPPIRTETPKTIKIESAPDISLEPYWPKLEDVDKQKVWQYYESGYSVEAIIEALE